MRPRRFLRLVGVVTLLALFLVRVAWATAPRQANDREQPSLLLGWPRFAPLPGKLEAASWPSLAPAWQIEIVDSVGDVGEFNSLSLDMQDHPHISYWDRDLWVLKYAHNDGSGWITETVHNAGYVNWDVTSLAVDAAGRPHIAYGDWDRYELGYAHYDDSSWLTETVDLRGGGASLALDAAGRPHIGYSGGGLRYAYYDGSTWFTETVDWDGHGIHGISLALDQAGRPHFSYIKGLGLLVYAYYDGAQWVYEDLRGVGEGGSFTSLVLDGADQPHIAYNAGGWTGVWLGYMHYDSQQWQDEKVEGEYLQYISNYGDLALDAAGDPHIAYAYRGTLRHAHHDGEDWWIEVVDSYGSIMSLALDSTGWARISYNYAGDLKYATQLCMPVLGANIDGPARLPVGVTALYSATTGPRDADLPITLTWQDGTLSTTAPYSWTAVGTTTLAVTATNPCGEARGALTVTVCQPLTGVALAGPPTLFTSQVGTYQASSLPLTATPPLTYTWDNGVRGPTGTYSWPATGTYTLAVTATNDCGSVVAGSLSVQVVEWPYHVYLPLLWHE